MAHDPVVVPGRPPRDKTISPELERFEAKRAGSHTIEVNSSHVAMMSHPDKVASLIRSAADSTR